MFPLAKFRILYPMFSSVTDEVVLAVAEEAQCLVNGNCGDCSDSVWMAVVAHMLALREAGNRPTPGALASASIDKVSVSFHGPVSTENWGRWLGLTPYGQKALALLGSCAAGGVYAGGMPERDAFRSVYGIRGGRR